MMSDEEFDLKLTQLETMVANYWLETDAKKARHLQQVINRMYDALESQMFQDYYEQRAELSNYKRPDKFI